MKVSPYQSVLNQALRSATDTRELVIGQDNAAQVPVVFNAMFPGKKALVVADTRTYNVCGHAVDQALRSAGIPSDAPYIFDDPKIFAEFGYIDMLDAVLRETDAILVAVGSGTINDLAKLSSHRNGRRYMSVATAASMDGYTAYGASITFRGSKQTFECPAPLAVVADLDVIKAAPPEMNASGYADLLAKLPAGADWIVADALGIEPIDPPAWQMVQGNLREWLADPAGVAAGELAPIESLVAGLMMGGFAMQHLQNSRPASGAEHQFSHLWDMQAHKFNGKSVSHGFKVGIGSVASTLLYEYMATRDFESLDVNAAMAQWPTHEEFNQEINDLFDIEEIRDKAITEVAAKYPTTEELRQQLTALKNNWPDLRQRLADHLPPSTELIRMLTEAGAPSESEAIGISPDRLKLAYRQALHIRRRYTILDLADRTGTFKPAMDSLFQTVSTKA